MEQSLTLLDLSGEEFNWSLSTTVEDILNMLSDVHGMTNKKIEDILKKMSKRKSELNDFYDFISLPRKLRLRLNTHIRGLK